MITGTQLLKLLNDYGPSVAFFAFIVGLITGLVLLWKPVSKFVTATNTILGLPARLDEQDVLAKDKKELITSVQRELREHIKECGPYIDTVKVLEKQVNVILSQQADIVHEVKPNSGSSLADAVNRTEGVVHELATQVSALATLVTANDKRATSARRRSPTNPKPS